MTTMIPPRQMGDWQPYVFYDKPPFCFSPSECEAIIHLAKTLQPVTAQVGGAVEDPTIRISELRWMKRVKASRWIYDRLATTIQNIQQNWYPFNLSGFVEPLQITHYIGGAEGGHYEEHRDFGAAEMSTRKLSLVVLLADPNGFEGGALEVLAVPGADKRAKAGQGTIIAFPSWELHRVTRVTSGERWSLVSWVHGEPFR